MTFRIPIGAMGLAAADAIVDPTHRLMAEPG
jgi:hypothetical protein